MTDLIGQQLGNYRLLRLLGQGGFAEVYLAEHLHLGTQAALKILHIQLGDDTVQQFRREAQIIATLKSPHIVQVLDFGIERSIPFLVMDFAPKGSLRHICPKGTRLSMASCITYVREVAEALGYAHKQKVIHRDVKPENMLVGSRGEILLSDFGIAVISQSSRYQGNQEIGGTVAYMAPEQLQGKAVPASDQYALGIVLYEWLCGTLPFTGSFVEICSQHVLAQPPSLREQLPTLPAHVEAVVFKALAKDPAQRYPTITTFAAALEHAGIGQTNSMLKKLAPERQAEPTALVMENREWRQPTGRFSLQSTILPQIPPTLAISPNPVTSVSAKLNSSRKYQVTIALLLLIIVLMGTGGWYFLNGRLSIHSNFTNSSHPYGVATVSNQATSTFFPTPIPTFLPTPTPTSSPREIAINRKLVCIRSKGCSEAITIDTIIIDHSNTQILMKMTVKDVMSYGLTGLAFDKPPYFRDSTDQTYSAQGQATEPFNIGPGQSLELTALFPFEPHPNVIYMFHIETNSFYMDTTRDAWQDEQFTF